MPGPVDLIGASTVTRGKSLTWTWFGGETTTVEITGERTAVKAVYQSYVDVAGFSPTQDEVTYSNSGGKAVCTIHLIADGQPVYELMANEVMAPLEGKSDFDTVPITNIVKILQAVQNLDETFTGIGATAALQLNLYKHMIRGIRDYPLSQYVLRETKVVSKRSTTAAAYEKANKVDTPPETSTVNTLIGSLPTGEWIKKNPIVRTSGARKWQIQTEWWWTDRASKLIYGGTFEP